MATLGYHVSKDKNYADSLQLAIEEYNITTAQIYVGGPRSKKLMNIDTNAIKKFVKKHKFPLYAHNSLIAHPWKGDPTTIQFIQDQMNVCAEAGIKGLVVHLPKGTTETVMEILPQLLHEKTWLFLEIPSMKPAEDMSWDTPERINELTKQIKKNKYERVGICIDTSHIFACGTDVSSKKQADEWLNKLKRVEYIKMIHLNDSLVPLAAHKDVHAQIMQGYMWKTYTKKIKKSGLASFMNFAIEHKLPVILERQGLKNENLDQEISLLQEHFAF